MPNRLNTMNLNAIFEERYGGKTPEEFNEEGEMFTAIEMMNFARHCVEKKTGSCSISDIRLLKILRDLKAGRITVTDSFNQIKGSAE